MKKSIQVLFLALATMMIVSCTPTINYFGEKYAPTTDIDVYYDAYDVKKEYKVMGYVKSGSDYVGWEFDDAESVQKEMKKKAREVGADAIIYMGPPIDKYNPDSSIPDKVYEAKFIKYQK